MASKCVQLKKADEPKIQEKMFYQQAENDRNLKYECQEKNIYFSMTKIVCLSVSNDQP